MPDEGTKLENLAKIIDGQIVANAAAIQVCVKGFVSGFPVKLEATQPYYPFAVSYYLETGHFNRASSKDMLKLVIMPKYARGKLSVITRFLFFERQGQKIENAALDSAFIFKFDNPSLARQFVHHGNVAEIIQALDRQTHFNEMVIKSDAGIYLSQPTAFNTLNLEQCKETFNTMALLAEVLFKAF